ncbi:MAG: glycosyltransferase [Clostridium celatum]|nr:glycosyltransferase [Clostridium celatum]
MNILYINHEDSLGGGSKSLLGIIDEMNLEKDVNITVVIPNFGNGSLKNELEKRNIKYIKLKYSWWMISKNIKIGSAKYFALKYQKYINNYFAAKKLANICKENNIDIIHSNSSVINLGGLVSKLTGIKHIWHIREFGDDDHNLNFINGIEYSAKFMSDNSDYVVAISKAIYEKYKNYIDKAKFKVIYNGVEVVEDYKKVNDLNDKENFNILLAGAIKPNKGQKQAILAVNDIIKSGNDKIILNLAGIGEDGYDEYLKELVKELDIEKNVNFLGFTSNLNEIRKNMDVELVCSKKEAFGRVTVEAMMCGNPVIGVNTGGTKELISNEINGFLYDDENIEQLVGYIRFFINNPEQKKLMGQRGREFAVKNFTSKINANNIYKLYCDVARKKN